MALRQAPRARPGRAARRARRRAGGRRGSLDFVAEPVHVARAFGEGAVAWRRGEGVLGGVGADGGMRAPAAAARHSLGGGDDVFVLVEDGAVELTLAEGAGASAVALGTRSSRAKRVLQQGPRGGAAFLAADGQVAFTSELTCLTDAKLAFVPADIFQQAVNQPSMAVLKQQLQEQRATPPQPRRSRPHAA